MHTISQNTLQKPHKYKQMNKNINVIKNRSYTGNAALMSFKSNAFFFFFFFVNEKSSSKVTSKKTTVHNNV